MSDGEFDLDIDHYSREELLDILHLSPASSSLEITEKVDETIKKYELKNNVKYSFFFKLVRNKLLNEERTDISIKEDKDLKQAEVWYKNQYLLQDNKNQKDKYTDRKQKIQTFDTGAVPVQNQETLGINNTIPLELVQDSLNPTLRQTIKRYLTIDSQYRPYGYPFSLDATSANGSDTNYTYVLSETLNNVMSINLDSLFIPPSWYTFDIYLVNTCFWIRAARSKEELMIDNSFVCSKVCITPGNYSSVVDLVVEINQDISLCAYDTNPFAPVSPAAVAAPWGNLQLHIQNILSIPNKVQFLNLTSENDPGGGWWYKLIFYPGDTLKGCAPVLGPTVSSLSSCYQEVPPCAELETMHQNLGYYLGFRIVEHNKEKLDIIIPPLGTSQDEVLIRTLVTNANSALLSNPVSDSSAVIYYHNTMKEIWKQICLTCVVPSPLHPLYEPNPYISDLSGVGRAIAPVNLHGPEYFLLIIDEFNQNMAVSGMVGIAPPNIKLDMPGYIGGSAQTWTTPENPLGNIECGNITQHGLIGITDNSSGVYVATYPRKLTQNQLYAVNQIKVNREAPKFENYAPNNSNVFAVIYLPKSLNHQKNGVSIFSTDLQYQRKYFGPITIDRLGVKLVDPRGNLVNLHGLNWSFTLSIEQLYQY